MSVLHYDQISRAIYFDWKPWSSSRAEQSMFCASHLVRRSQLSGALHSLALSGDTHAWPWSASTGLLVQENCVLESTSEVCKLLSVIHWVSPSKPGVLPCFGLDGLCRSNKR